MEKQMQPDAQAEQVTEHVSPNLAYCRSVVQNYGQMLTPREREVLCFRYGLTDGKVHTLQETAERLGTSCERIRQIELHAHRKYGRSRAVRVKRIREFYQKEPEE